jgi:hypothetical protein
MHSEEFPNQTYSLQPTASSLVFRFHLRRRTRKVTGPEAALPPGAEPGRVPRISRLMSLAIKFQGLIRDGIVEDYADLARLGLRIEIAHDAGDGITEPGSRHSGRDIDPAQNGFRPRPHRREGCSPDMSGGSLGEPTDPVESASPARSGPVKRPGATGKLPGIIRGSREEDATGSLVGSHAG